MKICTVIGARPQFIKAAVVSRALYRQKKDRPKEVIIHTGQHYDENMSSIFFDELEIPKPDYHLGIGGGTHGQNSGRMIESIEDVLLKESPDLMLVYGDTDSTLAGALAASKIHIPVAHVEAGLRSFNRKMPEETNRILTDHISDILFAPTNVAIKNLEREGISGGKVRLIGDVMYDAMLFYSDLSSQKSNILQNLGLTKGSYVLATFHRAENTAYENLNEILIGLSQSPHPVILPLHPRTKKAIESFHLNPADNIRLIDPVGYLDMVALEKNAAIIATDSGGVQKEAYFHSVPCITLRNETEWTELVDAGVNLLAGANKDKIAHYLNSDMTNMKFSQALYGDGYAGKKIVSALLGN